MAYASKELKTKVMGLIKDIAKNCGVKLTASSKITNHSTLSVNISKCSIDLKANLIETLQKRIDDFDASGIYGVNEYNNVTNKLAKIKDQTTDDMEWSGLEFGNDLEKYFSGEALTVVKAIQDAILCDHYDHSDTMTDYFDTAYYWNLNIGKNKGGFLQTA